MSSDVYIDFFTKEEWEAHKKYISRSISTSSKITLSEEEEELARNFETERIGHLGTMSAKGDFLSWLRLTRRTFPLVDEKCFSMIRHVGNKWNHDIVRFCKGVSAEYTSQFGIFEPEDPDCPDGDYLIEVLSDHIGKSWTIRVD